MPETGEYPTDHDAIVGMANDMKWVKRSIDDLRHSNDLAHTDIKSCFQDINARLTVYDADIAMLRERSKWTRWFLIGGSVLGGGGLWAWLKSTFGSAP